MKEQNFYLCKHCGNLVAMLNDSGIRMFCCGEKMTRLEPGMTDGAHEKHIPVVSIKGDTVHVEVGSILHPMTEAHYIEWIYLHTTKGGQFKHLQPGEQPIASFELQDEELLTVYEYCNLHKLYKADV